MVLLTWPELELVEYQVARIATTMPYIPGFLVSRNPRCWRRGSSFRKNRICSLSMATVFLIPGVWASPAILACWWMCRPSAWRKNACAAKLATWVMSRARWRR
jgi:hypothetical protein